MKERPAPHHYSYTLYADPATAQTFDTQRFGGPIGELIAKEQSAVLANFVGRVQGRTILDVGTGTGRAALLFAAGGAKVTAIDASEEMLAVARKRAAMQSAAVTFMIGDAHALDIRDRAFDVAVSLRVLMHTPEWRRCVAELCRVAERLVIIDYPSRRSAAALQAMLRRLRNRFGATTEAYRVFSDREIADALSVSGFRVRSMHRQFVLPIAVHKLHGSRRLALALRTAARSARAAEDLRFAGDARRRTVRALVTGATGFTGGHLARRLAARGHAVRALVRDPSRAGDLEAAGIELVTGDIRDRMSLDAASAGVEAVYHIAAVYRHEPAPTPPPAVRTEPVEAPPRVEPAPTVRPEPAPAARPEPPPAVRAAPVEAPSLFKTPAPEDRGPNRYDPTAPSVDLDAIRIRAGELGRQGTGNRALLPFPMPPVPDRKTKMETAIENARKPDCRKAYAELGLAAIVPLIANEFGEGKCRW